VSELVNVAVYIMAGVLSAIAVFFLGWYTCKKAGEGKLLNAERLAEKIVKEAEREAETQRKSSALEAKDHWFKAKLRFERETEKKRLDIERREKQLRDREMGLNRKLEVLEKKERDLKHSEQRLGERERATVAKENELKALISQENAKLERIAGMTSQEAKALLISNMERDARAEAARMINDLREEAMRTAEREARRIITIAIERCATDHIVESTVSVVSLPNDEMKGRIIGREGRNIRAFETITGIDVIIDDTPEAVILSGFDPVRREVARLALEKLVTDGRIHPGRIEEVVAKTQKEVDEKSKEAGEQAALEAGVHGLHPELIKLLGRLHYRTSFGQNVLQHSKEVAFLAGMMARELGLDAALARRAGLLHDVGKAIDHETEGTHASIGMEIAARYGEAKEVVEAIGAHHEERESDSLIGVLVKSADAVSGARPGARRETLETYIKRLQKLEGIADSFEGVEKAYAIQAGREIRVMVEPKLVDDVRAASLAVEVARKIEKESEYPGQIKVVVIRESRAVDYAK